MSDLACEVVEDEGVLRVVAVGRVEALKRVGAGLVGEPPCGHAVTTDPRKLIVADGCVTVVSAHELKRGCFFCPMQ